MSDGQVTVREEDQERKEGGGRSLFVGSHAGLSIGELLRPTLVKLKVGADLQEYDIPKAVICGQSRYFKAAFEHDFAEGQKEAIELPDEKPELFDIYVAWLYTQALTVDPSKPSLVLQEPASTADTVFDLIVDAKARASIVDIAESRQSDPEANDATTWPWQRLFQLYILGDKYDTRGFRTSVMETIQVKVFQIWPCKYKAPDLQSLQLAFTNLPTSSQLYIFLIELITFDVKPLQSISDYASLPSDALAASWRMLKQGQDRRHCGTCRKYDARCENDECAACKQRPKCTDVLHGDFQGYPEYDNNYHAYHEHMTVEEDLLCRARWDLIANQRFTRDQDSAPNEEDEEVNEGEEQA